MIDYGDENIVSNKINNIAGRNLSTKITITGQLHQIFNMKNYIISEMHNKMGLLSMNEILMANQNMKY